MSKEKQSFFYYRENIEKKIQEYIPSFGKKTKLRDACEYALTNGGKRYRPVIVYMIAEALKTGADVSLGALSVELFHTASLIADDLPCMDNDDERREKPSLHKVYGETVALLASYALITAAFELIYKNVVVIRESNLFFAEEADAICSDALKSAAFCSGILGATGGQFLDLFPPKLDLEMVREVIYKKTVTLFEVSFIFGWLFGGGNRLQIDLVKKASYHLGMAFQIADDLGDIESDSQKQRKINIALVVGKEKSFEMFKEEMGLLKKCLSELEIYTTHFQEMCFMLEARALSFV